MGEDTTYSENERVAKDVPQDAAEILGKRGTHGEAVENHRHIADMWSAYLGIAISAAEVANMMVLMKQSRDYLGDVERDHSVDQCGYSGIAWACQVADREEGVSPPYHDSTEEDSQEGENPSHGEGLVVTGFDETTASDTHSSVEDSSGEGSEGEDSQEGEHDYRRVTNYLEGRGYERLSGHTMYDEEGEAFEVAEDETPFAMYISSNHSQITEDELPLLEEFGYEITRIEKETNQILPLVLVSPLDEDGGEEGSHEGEGCEEGGED
jgi:hypothetical protein